MPPERQVDGAAAIGAFMAAAGRPHRLVATPTAANRQPAVLMQERTATGGLVPHRLVLLDVDGDRIAALRAFLVS